MEKRTKIILVLVILLALFTIGLYIPLIAIIFYVFGIYFFYRYILLLIISGIIYLTILKKSENHLISSLAVLIFVFLFSFLLTECSQYNFQSSFISNYFFSGEDDIPFVLSLICSWFIPFLLSLSIIKIKNFKKIIFSSFIIGIIFSFIYFIVNYIKLLNNQYYTIWDGIQSQLIMVLAPTLIISVIGYFIYNKFESKKQLRK